MIAVGTAGWSVPKRYASEFPSGGSHLERYAGCFNAVEINTSFHRPHRVATYERWATSVPDGFRFAVKIPRTITHDRRLVDIDDLLARFLDEVAGLGSKLGPLLLQLPPSLAFEPDRCGGFLTRLRGAFAGALVCEPRHPSWFAPAVDLRLRALRIGRVASDPPPVPGADEPGGWTGLACYRLHGSPDVYYSAYSQTQLRKRAEQLLVRTHEARDVWCIFDNTAALHATGDALTTLEALEGKGPHPGGPSGKAG
ncbi:DUF72 domain-containing protein [Methylobacterium planeticum]|uniref:DUF72 domain-containing protein n=1 Tax=Methylobacterium planeticum TaxID=2615211 RepID=A0A6N6MQI0_9HYPH|nr:DUF72 domain-containing protein [Methylobacterium planeticum]KAB1072593.1 DUF72 domain-containing protein [Methylobacterium planeticum]